MKLFQAGNVVFNLEALTLAMRNEEGTVTLYFMADSEPLSFYDEAAEELWRALENASYLLTQSNSFAIR
jgi:hypothetical protein